MDQVRDPKLEIGRGFFEMQAKLLRVLQQGKVVSLGGTRPTVIDVLFLAASQTQLE